MNHCTSGRDIDIGPLGTTVRTRTGPRFSFSTNSGALQSFMFCARGSMYSPGFRPNGRIASCSRSASGGAGSSPRCQSGAMWMIELAMKTITAEASIGSQSAAMKVMDFSR